MGMLKYGDHVRVTALGFYNGVSGEVINYTKSDDCYTVKIAGTALTREFYGHALKKVARKANRRKPGLIR